MYNMCTCHYNMWVCTHLIIKVARVFTNEERRDCPPPTYFLYIFTNIYPVMQ